MSKRLTDLILKYSELEKCRCVPKIGFPGTEKLKLSSKYSWFIPEVLKTRERSARRCEQIGQKSQIWMSPKSGDFAMWVLSSHSTEFAFQGVPPFGGPKLEKLEKCRCVPPIGFRGTQKLKLSKKYSRFIPEVLKTRETWEMSLCTSDWVPGNWKLKLSKKYSRFILHPIN